MKFNLISISLYNENIVVAINKFLSKYANKRMNDIHGISF